VHKVIAKLLYGIAMAQCGVGLILGFGAYFVRSFDRETGSYFDGLGRRLYLAPFIARFVLGTDSLWPGWSFFLLDLVVAWSAIGIGVLLVRLAMKLEAKRDTEMT